MPTLVDALAGITTDAQPTFQPTGGDWTPERLRSTLAGFGLTIRERSGKLDIIGGCPLCRETEGNPAAWLTNGYPTFKCFRQKCNGDWAKLKAKLTPPARLPRINAFDLPTLYPHKRPDVVTGLIRRGDVAGIVGAPKSRKSFFMSQMALSVAAGIPFLQWPTVRGRVLIVDNELRPDDLGRRLTAMVAAMGLAWGDVTKNIDVISLRGRLADLYKIRDELVAEPDQYSLVILDAFYKSVPRGLDENSNSDMTSALVLLDESAERHNCGLAFAHHLSKGNQAGKAVTDLGSGAGAQSRSVDCHLAMTAHEDDNTVILQGVLRSQPPFEPVCLTFDYPIWRVASDKDPTAIANPQAKYVPSLESFIGMIPAEPTPKAEVIKRAQHLFATSKASAKLLLEQAASSGLIEINEPANRKLPHTVRRLPACTG